MTPLDPSGYTFITQPTKLDTQIFEYVAFDYIQNNPGLVGNAYTSYVGIYYDSAGDKTS